MNKSLERISAMSRSLITRVAFRGFAAALLLVPAARLYADFTDPLNVTSIQELVYNILNTIVVIMFPIMVMMIVYTGFLFVTARGNPTKITSARTALLWTIVGALVVLGAKALALAIKATVESL